MGTLKISNTNGMKFLLFSFLIVSAVAAEPDGKLLFTQNCAPCHAADTKVVGPSLVEISSLYGKNPDGFVHWCTAPGKKRADTIEMPSMAHLGEENLLAVFRYILQVSKGTVEKKVSAKDPFAAAPTLVARPLVQRIFMPNAGPAAIAVAFDAKTSLCWDAGACRLRYVWTGGFIDGYPYWKGNGNNQAKVVGKVRYTESQPPFGNDGPVVFRGYDLKNGLPVFRYSAGVLEVSESFEALPDGQGIVRHFTLAEVPRAPLTLLFPADAKTSITSDRGTFAKGALTLTPAEAKDFTLTLTFR